MERRALLLGAGLVVAGAAAQTAIAAQDHSQHQHGGAYPTLAAAAANCVKTGQVCLDHCFDVLGQGDKALAACARSVNELTAVCATLQQLAAQTSTYLAKYAKVAMEVCQGCEAECRKHEKTHAACKECADACAACAKECQSV